MESMDSSSGTDAGFAISQTSRPIGEGDPSRQPEPALYDPTQQPFDDPSRHVESEQPIESENDTGGEGDGDNGEDGDDDGEDGEEDEDYGEVSPGML